MKTKRKGMIKPKNPLIVPEATKKKSKSSAKTKKIEESFIHDPDGLLKGSEKPAAVTDPGLMGKYGEGSEKPAQPDKYASHVGKMEQSFLFGEADRILNVLETGLSDWDKKFDKAFKKKQKGEEEIEVCRDRIKEIKAAIEATRKHAPMKEDPAPPDTIHGAAASSGDTTPGIPEPQPEQPRKAHPEQIKKDKRIRAGMEAADKKKKDEPLAAGEDPLNELGEEEFREPDEDVGFKDIVKVGMLIRPNFSDEKYIVEAIIGPMEKITSSITMKLIDCPPVWTIHAVNPDPVTWQKEIYFHNLIIYQGKIRKVFVDSEDVFEIVSKVSAKKEDPY